MDQDRSAHSTVVCDSRTGKVHKLAYGNPICYSDMIDAQVDEVAGFTQIPVAEERPNG